MAMQDASNPQPRESLRLLGTVGVCTATAVLATPLHGVLDPANIVMLFLLTVLLVAVRWGRRAAILASVLSVLLFDVFSCRRAFRSRSAICSIWSLSR